MSKKLCFVVVALVLASLTGSAFAQTGKGNILIEEWFTANSGQQVTDNCDTLHAYINAGNAPSRSYWAKALDRPDGGEDYWGGRMRGYIHPPQTGDYTFWTCSDDDSEVWLSTDETPANAKMICNVEGWTDYQNWQYNTGVPGTTYKSAAIKLTAGKKYYVEVYNSDGTGGGHLSVAWGGPGIGAGPVVIDGKYLSPLIRTPEPMLNAQNPLPADKAVGVTAPLIQWTAGATALWHDFYFGTDPNPPLIGRQMHTVYFHIPGLEDGKTYYWKVVEIEADGVTMHEGPVWSFTAEPKKAFQPVPASGATGQLPGLMLSWLPGKGATSQKVFFSTDEAAVAAGAAAADKGTVPETQFNTGALRASTTYYWRVDTVTTAGVQEGEVWSFSTANAGPANKIVYEVWQGVTGTAVTNLTSNARYPGSPDTVEYVSVMESPVDWADSYGQRLWGWIKPPETGKYTFWIAGDDAQQLWLSADANPASAVLIASVASYTAARTWTTEAGQKSAEITLTKGQKYFIMALGKEGTGGDSTSVAWGGPNPIGAGPVVITSDYVDAFALAPLQAFGADPANGKVDAPQTGALSWNAGEQATSHDVYFGDDAAAVGTADKTSPLFKGNQAGTTFSAGDLEWGKTYYWRVDEVGAAETWKGTVWSFTTANFIPVDDMESYNDEEPTRIFDIWVDGYTDAVNGGSTVGNLNAPFAEKTIVHGGRQSMPMDYNNVASPYLSQADQTFAPLQNWTTNGVDTLSLWLRGQPVAFSENAGVLTVSGSGNDIWNNADAFRYVYKKLNGNGSITARVESLSRSDAWSKAGVMIRETLDPGSPHATTVVTSDNGASFQRRQFTGDVSSNTDLEIQPRIKAPYWVRITRTGNTFKSEVSPDGKAWRAMVAATPETSSLDIVMGASVYIGLAVTSHNVSLVSTGVFTDVTMAGTVSGQWQASPIGVDAQPGNSPAKVYVTVKDSAGKSATAVSADASMATATGWTEWKIPLSSFTGVNLGKVKDLIVGVGDPTNAAAGGAGRIYVDDIRVTKP